MDALRREIERAELLHGVRRLVAAVSGGPDSTALFLLLAELRDRKAAGFPDLLVGHVNHGLRGREADLDEAFARGLAESRGASFLVHRGDARAEAERRGLSPESGARALRHLAFLRWASETGVDAIALAHHMDDLAETVLLRAARGAGIRGLSGIPGERTVLRGGSAAVTLIRPLLSWRRAFLARFLEERGQPYRVDASNLDLSIPRNRVRAEVLPALEAAHPGAARSLARVARIARRWTRDTEALGRRAFDEALGDAAGAVELDVESLRRWPPTVVHEALRRGAREAARLAGKEEDLPLPAGLGSRAFDVLLGWVEGTSLGPSRLQTSGGAEFELRYGRIRITSRSPADEGARPGAREARPPGHPARAEAPLRVGEGPVAWGPWILEARELATGEAHACPDGAGSHVEVLDADLVDAAGPLAVRARRRGETFQPLGAPGAKPLKEFFRERRVWPSERSEAPLVAAGDAIAWVVGHRIAHPFRVTDPTRRRLEIRASMEASARAPH